MFGRLKRRRAKLTRTLEGDVTARLGWDTWLDGAGSIRELHSSCPHPGWLVYCAYFHDVSQDLLLEGALGLAKLASANDPAALLSTRQIERWPELSWPELAEQALALERRYPLVGPLLSLLPSQLCFALADLELMRVELRAIEAPAPNLGPFRADPHAVAREDIDGLVAAGYVSMLQCLAYRHEGLREALAVHAAAGATLLTGSYAGYEADALALLRRTYGWA